MPLRPRQKILPLAPIPQTFADRVLAVGDAAGLVKATTGGGIYYSLVSGALAAEVLIAGLRRDRLDAAALRPYETAWRRKLGPELQAQLRLRRIAHRLTDIADQAPTKVRVRLLPVLLAERAAGREGAATLRAVADAPELLAILTFTAPEGTP